MRKNILRVAGVVSLLASMFAIDAAAQDFQKTYRIGANDTVSIRNVSGDVKVTGYDGDAVSVVAYKEGRDREFVRVEDTSTANRVELRARYSEERRNTDASIRFEVRVPRGVAYNFNPVSTASGNIEASDITGNIRFSTASGNVTLKGASGSINATTASGNVRIEEARGSVNASTASGNVEAEITRLDGATNMSFSAASGNVRVRLPSNANADVEMSTSSGTLETEFPLEIEDSQYTSGKRARGRLGNGSRRVRLSSASGDVRLLKS